MAYLELVDYVPRPKAAPVAAPAETAAAST
jgi:hypothetical protein